MMDVNLGVVSTNNPLGSSGFSNPVGAAGTAMQYGQKQVQKQQIQKQGQKQEQQYSPQYNQRQSASVSLFSTIPPERVGLQGEYDHQGLAKRVQLAFQQNCCDEQISHLRISQRGAVIVIVGTIPTQRLLIKLVNLAMATLGAGDVEVNGVSVGYGLKHYLEIKPSQKALSQFLPLLAP